MQNSIKNIIVELEISTNGQPWYGDALLAALEAIPEAVVHIKVAGCHSIAELVVHMINWYQFSLERVKGSADYDLHTAEEKNWLKVMSADFVWQETVATLKKLCLAMKEILSQKDDAFLHQIVPSRNYDFAFLLKGLIQHNIYHLGQIMLLKNIILNQGTNTQ